MQKLFNRNSERGFAAMYVTILVLVITLGIGVSISLLIVRGQQIRKNIVTSAEAYYGAEAGIEDALFRINQAMDWSSPYSFRVGNATTTVTISSMVSGSRTITAEGDASNRIRKVRVVYQIDTDGVSFNFGAQVGDGGMEMRPGSKVVGNVFSNATVFGSGLITDSVVIARNGSKLDGVDVGDTACPTCVGDARVHTCKDADIKGTLTYVSGGSVGNCIAASYVDGGPNEIDPSAFPITPAMIADWKSDAEAGGIIDGGGNVTITANRTLGPGKITGNLTLNNNVTLTLTGTVWATGTFNPGNNSTMRLHTSYGDLSGMAIFDGNVKVENNVVLQGSGDPASFLLVIGTSSSVVESAPAIDVKNNAAGAILFAPNGLLALLNNINVTEATAYQVLLKNNATITYDLGLADTQFTSGPSGGWEVASWREVE